MATIKQDARRVIVAVSDAELNALLVRPAKDANFIDFNPTRIKVDQVQGTGFEITFEKVVAGGTGS